MTAQLALLEHLIDDAGMFPPAQLSLEDALANNARASRSAHGWMLGRFILPLSQFDRFAEHQLRASDGRASLSIVLDGEDTASDIARLARLRDNHASVATVAAIECRFARAPGADSRERIDGIARALRTNGFGTLPTYVEIGFEADWRATLEAAFAAVADATHADPTLALFGKVRCGGTAVGAVPSSEQLARFIVWAHRNKLGFKATAGLHHPIRRHDPVAGMSMHGFLNVIGAAILTHVNDLKPAIVAAIVADEDGRHFTLDDEHFAWSAITAAPMEIAAARAAFAHSFGSCSFTEPVTDLVELGILAG